MSRLTVRTAVQNWLSPDDIPGLANIFKTMPTFSDGRAYFTGQGSGFGNGSGAQAVVYVEHDREERLGMGQGQKLNKLTVAMLLYFVSTRPIDEAGNPTYMDDYDSLIESIKERIRADRKLGTQNLPQDQQVFQAGEGPFGIQVVSDAPVPHKNTLYIWGRVEFEAWTILAPA